MRQRGRVRPGLVGLALVVQAAEVAASRLGAPQRLLGQRDEAVRVVGVIGEQRNPSAGGDRQRLVPDRDRHRDRREQPVRRRSGLLRPGRFSTISVNGRPIGGPACRSPVADAGGATRSGAAANRQRRDRTAGSPARSGRESNATIAANVFWRRARARASSSRSRNSGGPGRPVRASRRGEALQPGRAACAPARSGSRARGARHPAPPFRAYPTHRRTAAAASSGDAPSASRMTGMPTPRCGVASRAGASAWCRPDDWRSGRCRAPRPGARSVPAPGRRRAR